MNLHKMTKEQLVLHCKRLQSENDNLQDELDRLSDCYVEMENKYAEAVNTLDNMNGIKNMDWFKFKLEIHNLMTPQLESFIEYYLQCHNE